LIQQIGMSVMHNSCHFKTAAIFLNVWRNVVSSTRIVAANYQNNIVSRSKALRHVVDVIIQILCKQSWCHPPILS
jgi:hypothetical protein